MLKLNISLLIYITIALTLCLVCSANEEDDIPVSKIAQRAPTLKFLYCYSCGYKKMYDQYVQIIKDKYDHIIVEGSNYNPSGINMFIAQAIGLLKMFIIVCILYGVNIFEYINQPRPSWWQWCIENKIYSCMMLFFLCNLVEGQLVQSGAFEIFLNNVPIWSKLESGRIPQPAELFQIIDSHMQFSEAKVNNWNGFAK